MINVLQKNITSEPDRARTPNNICVVGDDSEIMGCVKSTATYGHLMSDIELPLRIASAVTAQCDIDVNLPIFDTGGTITGYEYIMPYKGPGYEGNYWIEKDQYGVYQLTSECGVRKILRYPTLLEWYLFFVDYYDKLRYSCDGIVATRTFSTYEEMVTDPAYNNFLGITLSEAQALDTLAASRGGRLFFDWVSENCFPSYTPPTGTTLPQLMSYDEVLREIKWFSERQKYFEEWNTTYDGCRNLNNCCDCQTFIDKGGIDTYKWLMSIEQPHASSFCTRTASYTVPLMITNDIENIGAYSLLVRDYDPTISYTSTTITPTSGVTTDVLYNNRSCFLKVGEDGYEYDPTYQDILWGNLMPGTWDDALGGYAEKAEADKEWIDGIEIYKRENNIIETDIICSGSTSSKLSALRDSKIFYDENSNMLPGSLNKDSNGVYVQPNSNEILDVIYHTGNTANPVLISTHQTSRGKVGLYQADFLKSVVFYKKRKNGTRVLNTYNVHDLDFVTRYPINVPFSQQEKLQDGIFCDLQYYSSYIVQKADYGTNANQYRPVYSTEAALYNATWVILKYNETLKLTLQTNYAYWLDGETSIPIGYYSYESLTPDQSDPNIPLAKYYLKYRKYAVENGYNDENYSPIFFNELYTNITEPETLKADIYIDRGVNSAMQTHLRLGDASCFNDLIQLGNGYFTVIKNS